MRFSLIFIAILVLLGGGIYFLFAKERVSGVINSNQAVLDAYLSANSLPSCQINLYRNKQFVTNPFVERPNPDGSTRYMVGLNPDQRVCEVQVWIDENTYNQLMSVEGNAPVNNVILDLAYSVLQKAFSINGSETCVNCNYEIFENNN